jgi:hypothetical protein
VTSPSSISSSHARRLPSPARASTFWSRSPSCYTVTFVVVGRRLALVALARTVAAGEVDGAAGIGPEPVLERLHDLGAGDEVAEGRQLVEGVEPELLEERPGGAEQHGLPGPGIAGDLLDVAALLERAHDAVDVHAADRRHLGPRHRLLVGDDGQRLQRGGRQAGALALEDEALDVGRQIGVALEAVAAGDPHQLEAALVGVVGLGQLGAELLDPCRADLEQLGQQVRLDRRLGDHEHGLDGPGLLGRRHQPS